MNPSLKKLADELATDPESRGYASMTAEQAATDLNEPRYLIVKEAWLNERTLFALFGATRATEIMDGLQASTDSLSQRVYGMLMDRGSGGIDVGHAQTRGMVGSFVLSGLITQAEANQILALAETYQSRAKQIGYSQGVTEQMVLRVREEM
jgi:hypothetical protein